MFYRLKIFGWLLFTGAILLSGMQVMAQTFDALQWEYRVLVISAQDNEVLAQEQILLLSDHLEGIEERELIVLRLTGQVLRKVDTLSPFPFQTRILDDAGERRYLDSLFTSQTYAGEQMTVTLVGLDGGIKQVWQGVVEPAEIFDAIDAMPMRQREINRERNQE